MEARDYETILNSLHMTGIYVIREDNHQIMYFNQRVKEVAPDIQVGMVCHEVWAGSCANCPLLDIGDKKQSFSINYDDPFGKTVDIVATRILWGGEIPAFSIAVTPHADSVSNTYDKILKVNLTEDSFDIVKMGEKERKKTGTDVYSLSQWFKNLVSRGSIYRRDVKRFQKFVQIEHLREELRNGKNTVICTYRCREGKGYRWHIMEIVPDAGYTHERQTVVLYVKDVHDVYRKGLELEEINIQNQEIIKSLGELNFGVYVIDLQSGMLNPVRIAEDMKKTVHSQIYDWDELFDKMVKDHFHPEDQERLLEKFSLDALKKAEKAGKNRIEILCRRMMNGSYRYVSVTAHFSENGAGDPYVILALQDVDERTRQDIKRNQNDRQMAAIIKSAYAVMNLVDLETGQCERVYLDEEKGTGGVRTGDYQYFINKSAEEMIHPRDAERFCEALSLETLRKIADRTSEFEEAVYQFRCKGEGIQWLEEHLFFIRQEQSVTVNILSRDISEEKRKEAAIAHEKRERSYIIDSMSSLFFASYYLDLETNTYHALTQKAEVKSSLRAEMRCTEGFRIYGERFVHPDDREEYLAK